MPNDQPKFKVIQKKLLPIEIVTNVSELADQIESALVLNNAPVFVRGRALVQPVTKDYDTKKGGKTPTTILQRLGPQNIAYCVTKYAATFVKRDGRRKDKEALTECKAPMDALISLLTHGDWKMLKSIAGVITAPTMRPDGSIITHPGYDGATRLWLTDDPSLIMPTIPAAPTKQDAEEALKLLHCLFDEFPFVGVEDRAVALAGLLSAIGRGAFVLCPMFMISATTAGTGKSYLVNLISVILRGLECPVITAGRDVAETDKKLASILLEGPTIISIDNCTTDIDTVLLCQMIEQPYVKVRILGQSATPECEWRGTVFATGNNVGPVGDMVRRSFVCRLDAKCETPETREFKRPDALQYAFDNRGALIAACLTIMRAYREASDKVTRDQCHPLGSFGEWSRAVREPLIWLGELDPVKSMVRAREEDSERIRARTFLQQAQSIFGSSTFTQAAVVDAANAYDSNGRMGAYRNSELRAVLLEEVMERGGKADTIDPQKIQGWFRKIKGQWHAGLSLTMATRNDRKGARYRIAVADKAGG
ncbi:MAG: hypothetical protein Q8M31_21260 [Beijerinckiaceae bacterium]|nr:hypothetical protein [Beijerinckiaceae bacterium]